MGLPHLPSTSCSPSTKQRAGTGAAMLMLWMTKSMKFSSVVQQERAVNSMGTIVLVWHGQCGGKEMCFITSTFYCFCELFGLLHDFDVQFAFFLLIEILKESAIFSLQVSFSFVVTYAVFWFLYSLFSCGLQAVSDWFQKYFSRLYWWTVKIRAFF